MIARYVLWTLLGLVLVVPLWLYASLAGGESIFDATTVRAGHGGVILGILLMLAGLVAIIRDRASRAAPALALIAVLVMIASGVITALTV